ncbi:hypothetical protein D3C76_1429480 [compost metagenome]
MHPLAVDTVVDLQQQVAFLHLLKILHLHFGDIAVNLRADKGGLAAHVGVIGELNVTGKGRQLPGVEDHQHANDADRGGGEHRHHAQIITGIGLLSGGILLTHNHS